MGATPSTLDLKEPEEYLTQCCLALRECSSVRLIHAPKELKEVVQTAIEKNWSPGGSKVLDTDTIWEYRLKGLPFWNSFSPQRSLQVHSLICHVLDAMQVANWEVQTATDLSRCKDLSTFFLKKRTKALLERDEPVRGRRKRMMFSATLADKNKVYIVNAPKSTINQLYSIFNNHWAKGVLRVTRNKYGTIFTLKGEPWSDGKSASIQASSLVHRMVYTIGLMGWDVSTIARVKNFRDSIFFRQKRMKKFDDLVGCFLSISFYGKNRLRLIHCSDPSIANDIEDFLSESWEPGLEATRKIHGSIEFRLNGKPFWSDSTDGIDSKLLVCALLSMLQKKGWRIHNFISATRSLENKGTLLFKKEASSDVSPMCISFDDEDKLRLISATDDVKCIVRQVITNRLGPNGIVREGNFRNCWEFKLHGAPWTGLSSDEGIKVRSLLTHILQKLSFKGWHVMTSFDVCTKINKSDDRHPQPLDAQSWYLCKKESINVMFDKWKSKINPAKLSGSGSRVSAGATKEVNVNPPDAEPKNKKKTLPNSHAPGIAIIMENSAETSVEVPPKLGTERHLLVPEDSMEGVQSSCSLLGHINQSLEDMRLGGAELEPELGSVVRIVMEPQSSPIIAERAPTSQTSLRTDDMSTPESSLTNLIREFKTDLNLERQIYKDRAPPKTTIIETFDANNHDKDDDDDDGNDQEVDSLNIEEDTVGQVMCSFNLETKTISPVPSEEFHVPEIQEDLINTIFSDPPPFTKK